MSQKESKITIALTLAGLILLSTIFGGLISFNRTANAAVDYTYEPEIGMYAHIEYQWGEVVNVDACGSPPQTRSDTYSADVPLYITKDGSGIYTSSQPYGGSEHVQGGTYVHKVFQRDECAKKTCETPKEGDIHDILVKISVTFDKPTGIIHVQLISVHPVDANNPNTENSLKLTCQYDSGEQFITNPPMISFKYPEASWGDDPGETNFYIPPDSPSKLDVSRTRQITYGSQNDHILIEFKPVTSNPQMSLSLSKNEIKPEIGSFPFPTKNIVPIRGVRFDNTQPHVDGGITDLTVKVTSGTNNLQDVPVTLTFEPKAQTGGHTHLTNTADDKAKSAFGGFVGFNTPLKIQGKTDSNGEFTAPFRAENLISQYSSASGEVVFTATAELPNGGGQLQDQKELTIKVPGLESLGTGTDYTKYGDLDATNHKGNNHYGTQAVVSALQRIANEYAKTHNGNKLQIGQMSLTMGGVFDIAGTWDPASGSPQGHRTHACGTDTDVDDLASNGKKINKQDLAVIVNRIYPGAFVFDEENHYHIHFQSCR